MQNSAKNLRSAYTLVELMVGVTLSLVLLIAVTDMFRNIGDTINETQATLNMAQNLNNVALQLRADLGGSQVNVDNLDALARKPSLLATNPDAPGDGYLEISEGQGAPPNVIANRAVPDAGKFLPTSMTAYSPDSADNRDLTVGDVDDILAFTIKDGNFRGLIEDQNPANPNPDGKIVDATEAEVIWFLRGTNLYRRVLMIKTQPVLNAVGYNNNYTVRDNYQKQDLSISAGSATPPLNALTDLDRRENRFGRAQVTGIGVVGSYFPFPLHTNYGSSFYNDWYYLRMPTLEETVHSTWTPGSLSTYTAGVTPGAPFWDFWENPNGLTGMDMQTGSLSAYVSTPRNDRAGEDIILSNVIGFDVKVWNPYWVPCGTGNNANEWAPPQYIDLGQDQLICQDQTVRAVNYAFRFNNGANVNARVPAGIPTDRVGYGFVLKGRYNKTTAVKRTAADGADNEWYQADRIRQNNGTYADHAGTAMSCVFDSWSADYLTDTSITGLGANQYADPPYTEPLQGIQITIRCFEPQSGTIRQIRVVRNFNH